MTRLPLTAREGELLRALFAELATYRRPWRGGVPAELQARSRQVEAAIASAHGVDPAAVTFRAETATGRMWIEVEPAVAEARAAAAARFRAAVEAFPVAELPVDMEPPAAGRLRAKVAQGGPVLVGERHGVEQNPLVAYTLMRHLDVRVLGLEWSSELGPAMERFLDGGQLDAEAFAGCRDGRVTAGHLATLRTLRRQGRLERLVLFDPPEWPGSWSGRDGDMAERLLAELDGSPAVVMAGNLHTRLRRHRYGEPMGAHLARARRGTVELRLRYPGAGLVRWPGSDRCLLRVAGAWLELTLPQARQGVTPADS